MDELLPPQDFMRVHKSYTVALAAIDSVYGNTLEIGKVQVPIGSNYKADFMSRIARCCRAGAFHIYRRQNHRERSL
ncbi:hypothetical protein A4D02_09865 [Niastella koreensis]|uniref:HTH LytTR-type domain-containing protein n=1 Tax=Niastella koreensis TaxID=354356 RepID=A0ABX3NQT7_9BACT|nr:hypothetical protein A4D02_09865 [Niastella koreensis]